MHSHLAQFLTHNDPPSEAILTEVNELLSGPKSEIETKAAEIQRLNKKLGDLQKERDAIQQSMEKYSTILSPIRRIPSDILKHIFYLCLPTNHNPVMSVTEAPLLLIRICRFWRSTALSCHGLWAKLHIALPPYPFPNDDQYFPYQGAAVKSEAEQEADRQRYAKVIEARRQLMNLWLSRSGTHPLSLSLTYMGTIDQNLLDELQAEGYLPKLFQNLLSSSQQFDEIELDLPYNLCHILLSNISLENVQALRQLRISLCERIPFVGSSLPPTPQTEKVKRTITLFQASSLTRLSIRGDAIAQSAFDSDNIPSTWANLTHLSLDFGINSTDAFHIFRLCQKLEQCNLVITDCQDVYIDPGEILLMPNLKFLCVRINGTDLMSLLYKRIDAPALDWLEYQTGGSPYYNPPRPYGYSYYSPGGYQNSNLNTPTSPVVSLLEKSRKIKTLSLDPRNFSPKDILFSFRFASQLTHVIIGQRPLSYWSWAPSSPVYFNLDLLVIDDDAGLQDTGDGPHSGPQKEILLPNLEVFEAYNLESRPNTTDASHLSSQPTITDEIVKRFITGRLGNTATRRGVSSLKSVKLFFSRKKEVDIDKEVHQTAEQAGLEIELELRYTEPQPYSKYRDTFSPWYGLSEDDYSWRYIDADMEDENS